MHKKYLQCPGSQPVDRLIVADILLREESDEEDDDEEEHEDEEKDDDGDEGYSE
jgi:hypothetical protein